jgi:tetratricopeptide (TPR) repeat protein
MKYFLAFILVFLLLAPRVNAINIDSLIAITELPKKDTNTVLAYHKLARNFLYQNPDRAHQYIVKSAELSEKLKFYKGAGDSYIYEGAYFNLLGKYEKTIDSYKKAEINYKKVNFINGLAMCYAKIASVYVLISKYDEARASYNDGIKLLEVVETVMA